MNALLVKILTELNFDSATSDFFKELKRLGCGFKQTTKTTGFKSKTEVAYLSVNCATNVADAAAAASHRCGFFPTKIDLDKIKVPERKRHTVNSNRHASALVTFRENEILHILLLRHTTTGKAHSACFGSAYKAFVEINEKALPQNLLKTANLFLY